ncbi:MAG TPA: CDP-archaeol synthase [Steroidobacteraceae bacterium]
MIDVVNTSRALFLMIVANVSPWAAGRALQRHWTAPLDGGVRLWDGERLFGGHKTWRGVLFGTLSCALAAVLTGPGFAVGAAFGALSLTGDALSSAFKRRLRLAPGTEIVGLDQVPEALLPSMLLARPLGLGAAEICAAVVAFVVLDLLATKIRHAP